MVKAEADASASANTSSGSGSSGASAAADASASASASGGASTTSIPIKVVLPAKTVAITTASAQVDLKSILLGCVSSSDYSAFASAAAAAFASGKGAYVADVCAEVHAETKTQAVVTAFVNVSEFHICGKRGAFGIF